MGARGAFSDLGSGHLLASASRGVQRRWSMCATLHTNLVQALTNVMRSTLNHETCASASAPTAQLAQRCRRG